MKSLLSFSMLALLAVFFFACNQPQGEKAVTGDAVEETMGTATDTYALVNIDESFIEWKGTKPTGEHFGTVNIKEGKLDLQEGKIIGGVILIDFQTIKVLDLEDPDKNAQLLGHLKSPDFFSVDSFPDGTFTLVKLEEITGTLEPVEATGEMIPTHYATGNLQMKGITRSVTFPVEISEDEHQFVVTSPVFTINRAEWNIRYGSKSFFGDLKDNFIDDEIGLKITVYAAKESEQN